MKTSVVSFEVLTSGSAELTALMMENEDFWWRNVLPVFFSMSVKADR